MRCIICDEEITIENKYGLTIYKHGDKLCKYLNNSNIDIYKVDIKIKNDRMLHALLHTRSGMNEISDRINRVGDDDDKLIELFDDQYENMVEIINRFDSNDHFNAIKRKLKIYLTVFNKPALANNIVISLRYLSNDEYNKFEDKVKQHKSDNEMNNFVGREDTIKRLRKSIPTIEKTKLDEEIKKFGDAYKHLYDKGGGKE